MSELYTVDDYHAGYPAGIETHFWHRTRHDALSRILRRHLPAQSRIMDIGCGMGITTRYLRERGFDCRGVELGPAPISEAVANYVQTDTDVFSLSEDERDAVDCVLLLDVIEHMAEPNEMLDKVRCHFKNCRYLLLTVPARQELWSEYDEAWGHIKRYSRDQLCEDVQAAGFSVRYCAYHFQALYLAARLAAALDLSRSRDFAPPNRHPISAAMHWLVAALGLLENRLIPGALPGSSLFCLAEPGNSPA